MLPREPRRLTGCSYRGARTYFLTFLTRSRRRFFLDEAVVHVCASQVLRAADRTRFVILAWCYMPDHLHLLVQGITTGADMRGFAKLAKQLAGYYVKREHGLAIWSRRYYDRILREHEDPRRYLRYIRDNPVRARFPREASDYPFLFLATSWR